MKAKKVYENLNNILKPKENEIVKKAYNIVNDHPNFIITSDIKFSGDAIYFEFYNKNDGTNFTFGFDEYENYYILNDVGWEYTIDNLDNLTKYLNNNFKRNNIKSYK
jgi:hypothetical protein